MNKEIGKRYGFLTIIEDREKIYHCSIIYKFRCDCGNLVDVNSNKLHTGHIKSCSCKRHIPKDLVHQKFGKLEVLEYAYSQNNKNYWKCQCDCGNICYVCTASLMNGTTVSCGCKNEENKNNSLGVRGVHYDKDRKRWVAQLMFQRKTHLIGRFKTMREAIAARRQAEKEYYGKYRK